MSLCHRVARRVLARSAGGVLAASALACAALLVGFSGDASAASRVFSDGFESGGTGLWAQDDFRSRCQVVAGAADGSGGPRSGSRMLRCNWNGTLAWNDPARYETLRLSGWQYNREFLIRAWIRADRNATDQTAPNGPKYFRIGDRDSYGHVNFRTGTQYVVLLNNSGGQIGSTYWGSRTVAEPAWHQIEIYVRVGSSDGIVRIWEDDVRVWEVTNVNTTQASSWATFYISSNWSGAAGCCDHDATNYLYWDDFEIFSDQGTGASGTLADGTAGGTGVAPPSAPAGLRAQ